MPQATTDMLPLEGLLAPISPGAPCGDELEYDPAFLDLERTAKLIPERQAGATILPAQAPEWRHVRAKALALLARTKDLRVVMFLTVAIVHEQGVRYWKPDPFPLILGPSTNLPGCEFTLMRD